MEKDRQWNKVVHKIALTIHSITVTCGWTHRVKMNGGKITNWFGKIRIGGGFNLYGSEGPSRSVLEHQLLKWKDEQNNWKRRDKQLEQMLADL